MVALGLDEMNHVHVVENAELVFLGKKEKADWLHAFDDADYLHVYLNGGWLICGICDEVDKLHVKINILFLDVACAMFW